MRHVPRYGVKPNRAGCGLRPSMTARGRFRRLSGWGARSSRLRLDAFGVVKRRRAAVRSPWLHGLPRSQRASGSFDSYLHATAGVRRVMLLARVGILVGHSPRATRVPAIIRAGTRLLRERSPASAGTHIRRCLRVLQPSARGLTVFPASLVPEATACFNSTCARGGGTGSPETKSCGRGFSPAAGNLCSYLRKTVVRQPFTAAEAAVCSLHGCRAAGRLHEAGLRAADVWMLWSERCQVRLLGRAA